MRSARVVIFAAVIAVVSLAQPTARSSALGNVGTSGPAIAGGKDSVAIGFVGQTSSPADQLGDAIEFSVSPATGSVAAPIFTNGLTTQSIPLGGLPCPAQHETVPVAQLTKCFARTAVTSVEAGDAVVTMRNPRLGPQLLRVTITFLKPRVVIPRMTVPSPNYGTSLHIQNTGTAPAIYMTGFYNSSGDQVAARRNATPVPPGAMRVLHLSDEPLLLDFDGMAIVASDQPAAVTIYHDTERGGRIRRAMANALPYDEVMGAATLSLPYVANALENTYNTRFSIANTGRTTSCVRVTYTFVPGAGAVGPEGRAPLVHPGGGGGACAADQFRIGPFQSVTIAPSSDGRAILFPAGTKNTLMSATIESQGGHVGAVVLAFTSDATVKEAGYEGFRVSGFSKSDVSKDIALPLAMKTADGYYTQVLFSNPGDAAADVTITYTGSTGTHVKTLSVPAGGVTNHSTYSDNVVPSGFIGAARISSTQPLAAVLFRAKKVDPNGDLDEDLYTAVAGQPAEQAATVLAFPLIVRRVDKLPGRDGANSWISVTVPGGGAANLTLRAVGTCSSGGVAPDSVFTATKRVTGSFVFYTNAEADTGLGGTPPSCFNGAVMITSDVPILAVASFISDRFPGDGEAVYTGIAP